MFKADIIFLNLVSGNPAKSIQDFKENLNQILQLAFKTTHEIAIRLPRSFDKEKLPELLYCSVGT